MITAKTKDGFEVELDENALDYRLMEDIVNMQTDFTKLFPAVNRLLSEEDKNRLLDHLADKNGKVPLEAVSDAFSELITSFSDGKNSASSPN